MKKLLLIAVALIALTGCSTKKLVVCEAWGNVDCPTGMQEKEGSIILKLIGVQQQAGIITDNITSCYAYTENNSTLVDSKGFSCIEVFK